MANPALAWRGWLFSDQPGETDSDTQGLGGVRVVLSVTSCSDAHPYPALEWTGSLLTFPPVGQMLCMQRFAT